MKILLDVHVIGQQHTVSQIIHPDDIPWAFPYCFEVPNSGTCQIVKYWCPYGTFCTTITPPVYMYSLTCNVQEHWNLTYSVVDFKYFLSYGMWIVNVTYSWNLLVEVLKGKKKTSGMLVYIAMEFKPMNSKNVNYSLDMQL